MTFLKNNFIASLERSGPRRREVVLDIFVGTILFCRKAHKAVGFMCLRKLTLVGRNPSEE